ncbi:MAG: hypothetical protein AAGD00_01375 [Planctomycetota bacterium]
MVRTIVAASAACLLAAPLAGCEGYALTGRVVQGDASYVTLVAKDDPRLAQQGIAGAHVRVETDPMRLSRKTVATGVSDAAGDVKLPIAEFGAGWLDYDVGVFAGHEGFRPAEGFFDLPPEGSALLIVLEPGAQSTGSWQPAQRENLMEEYERFR